MQSERYIATVDLGSSKIALCVAKVEEGDIQVIYYKEHPSMGIRYSRIFNAKRASDALRLAVEDAEKELDIKILQLVVGLPRYELRQETASARMERSDPDSWITREELNSLKSMAIDSYPLEDDSKEEIYGAVAQSFSADDLIGASENDIEGVTSSMLEGQFKIFIGKQNAIKNIDLALNSIGVAPAKKVFLPATVAKTVLSESEKDNGVAVMEIGAEVTSVSIYCNGLLRYYSSIPFGGKNITLDVKTECTLSERFAENIKLAYGGCLPDKLPSLGEKIIQINDEENGTYEQFSVEYLSEIITARAQEIVNAMLFCIQESGYSKRLRNGIVITGGGANLVNLSALIRQISGYSVRIGYPRSRDFSSGGCPGVLEASATAAVGMVLDAARDARLNCVEEHPSGPVNEEVEQAQAEDAPALDEQGKGNLFGFEDEEVITPTNKNVDKKKEKTKKGDGKLSWLKHQIGNAAGKLFDDTLGDSYDGMK